MRAIVVVISVQEIENVFFFIFLDAERKLNVERFHGTWRSECAKFKIHSLTLASL